MRAIITDHTKNPPTSFNWLRMGKDFFRGVLEDGSREPGFNDDTDQLVTTADCWLDSFGA